MKLLNKIGLFTPSDIKNMVSTGRERGLGEKIVLEQLDRTKANIEDWRNALLEAEDVDFPDRTELLRLWQEVLLDDTVSAFIEDLQNKILAADFDIVNEN